MKQTLKEAWYFSRWLIKQIDWWFVLWIIVLIMTSIVWFVPDNIALILCAILMVYYFCFAVYFLIYKPLKNAYGRYKQEQLDIFNIIKNSK